MGVLTDRKWRMGRGQIRWHTMRRMVEGMHLIRWWLGGLGVWVGRNRKKCSNGGAYLGIWIGGVFVHTSSSMWGPFLQFWKSEGHFCNFEKVRANLANTRCLRPLSHFSHKKFDYTLWLASPQMRNLISISESWSRRGAGRKGKSSRKKSMRMKPTTESSPNLHSRPSF